MPVYKTNKITKDGRKWYFVVNYKENNKYKKKYSKYYLTKTEAQDAEMRYKLKGEGEIKISIKELYYDFIDYKKNKVKPSSLLVFNKNYTKLSDLKYYDLKKINLKILESWKNKMNPNNSPIYKNKILKFLKGLNNYCYKMYNYKNQYIDRLELFRDTRIKEEMKIYSVDEFNKFISKIDKLNYKALFTVLFYCGLRYGEAIALNWNDYNGKTLRINKTLSNKIKGENYTITTPKTSSSIRTIPVSYTVKDILNKLYAYNYKTIGFKKNWFIFRDIIPLKDTTVQKIKKKAIEDAGIKTIRIHDFRHSCASLLISKGANAVVVAKYLGHSDIKMTLNTYSHLLENDMQKIVDHLNF